MRYSVFNRVWHWLLAFTFMVMVMTVLLRTTFFDKKANALIIQQFLTEKNITISSADATNLAKIFRDNMYIVHIYAGQFLLLLILLKLFHMIFKRYVSSEKATDIHGKLRNALYFIILLIVCSMIGGGEAMVFSDTLGIPHDTVEEIEEIHGTLGFVLMGVIALHVIGVIRAEIADPKFKGIISKMISGDKK